jgi:hypothetical protein
MAVSDGIVFYAIPDLFDCLLINVTKAMLAVDVRMTLGDSTIY